jgi:O-antigen ligase
MLTLSHLKMLDLARWLLIGLSITILFSPFLSNVIEITLLGLFIFNQELRSRLANIKKQPLAIGVGAFILMLIIGCFYSMADYQETLRSLWGWRKILLLPIALSLFADHVWKDRFIKVSVGFIFLCSLLSIVHLYGSLKSIVLHPVLLFAIMQLKAWCLQSLYFQL